MSCWICFCIWATFTVVPLSGRLVGLALGNFVLEVALAQFALSALLTEFGQTGGVEPLAPQEYPQLAGFVAGVGFFEDAEFVGGGEASSGGFLDHLGIRNPASCFGEKRPSAAGVLAWPLL